MDTLQKFKINVSKRTLFLIAGLVWGFAGWRVSSLGYIDLFGHAKNPLPFLTISVAVFFVFYKFIFSKMVKKHRLRIFKKESEKLCVFSFFDKKSYLIMIFMMTFGITLRNAQIVNPTYLGAFYIGLGLALFSAGVMFLYSALSFEKFKLIHAEI